MHRFSSRFDRVRPSGAAEDMALSGELIAHPLPRRLLPEARGILVTRLRASLRRPPVTRPSLS